MSQAESRLNSLYRSVRESFAQATIDSSAFEQSGYVYKTFSIGNRDHGSILLTTGVHGDERNLSILPCIAHLVQSVPRLPYLFFIDFANPTSLRRLNGHDLNRGFYPDRRMHMASQGFVRCIQNAQDELGEPFDLGIDFHGDYGSIAGGRNTMNNKHYVYDSNDHSYPLKNSRKELRRIGILPFEGQDDFDVTGLGTVVDGYVPNAVTNLFDGSLQSYIQNMGHARTSWTAEVPVISPELSNLNSLHQPIKAQTAITHHILQAGIETVRASR